MITWMQTMMECRHATSRLERYLDADPSAPLPDEERARLAAHLAVCARCSEKAARHRLLRTALRRLGEHRRPDDAAVARLRHLVRSITNDDDRT